MDKVAGEKVKKEDIKEEEIVKDGVEKNNNDEKDSKSEKKPSLKIDPDDVNSDLSELEDELKEKDEIIEKKDKEIISLKELLMRRQADFENYKKRSLKDTELNKKLAIKNIALDIMDVHDNLLRASEAAQNIPQGDSLEKAHESYVQGVVMISKNIETVLEKYGIEEIEAIDIPFNPEYHEAVEFDMSEDVDCDTVTRVHQKGFRLDNFVIRTSKVKVTKPLVIAENNEKEEVAEESKEEDKDSKSDE